MLGELIMMAPIVEPSKMSRKVYMPKGNWTHFFTNKTVESKGEVMKFKAPYGEPIAFVLDKPSGERALIPI
jgi:alpha-glucosidase (family GH31 glycosyl hydrolase)